VYWDCRNQKIHIKGVSAEASKQESVQEKTECDLRPMPSEFPLFEIPLRRWTTKEPSPPVDLAMLRNIVFDYDYSYVPMEQLYTVVALAIEFRPWAIEFEWSRHEVRRSGFPTPSKEQRTWKTTEDPSLHKTIRRDWKPNREAPDVNADLMRRVVFRAGTAEEADHATNLVLQYRPWMAELCRNIRRFEEIHYTGIIARMRRASEREMRYSKPNYAADATSPPIDPNLIQNILEYGGSKDERQRFRQMVLRYRPWEVAVNEAFARKYSTSLREDTTELDSVLRKR